MIRCAIWRVVSCTSPSYRMNGIWGKWNIWKNWKSSTKYLEGLHVYFQLFRRRLISDEILQMFNVNIASKTYVKLQIWNFVRLYNFSKMLVTKTTESADEIVNNIDLGLHWATLMLLRKLGSYWHLLDVDVRYLCWD